MSADATLRAGASAVRAWLARVCDEVELRKDELNALDAAVGDGDMGISAANGFRAVREALHVGDDIGALLVQAGEAIEDHAGATIGALLGVAFLRAGRAVAGRTELGLHDITVAVEAAEQGIRERGKADVGDKTLLDVLAPVRATLRQGLDEDEGPMALQARVLKAAQDGVAATVPLRAKFGRGRWLGERSIGHADPGATLTALVIQSAIRP